LQAGTSGAIQAFEVAGALLATGLRAGLVIGGDVTDRFLDVSRPAAALSREDLFDHLLFGDAAGAAAVTARQTGSRIAVRATLHRFVGLGRAPGLIIDWSGAVRTEPGRRMLYEDHRAMGERLPGLAVGLFGELLARAHWRREDVGHLLPPQLSRRLTRQITDLIGLTGGCEISCVADRGNTGNAASLLQLHRLAAEFGDGERAVALALEPTKWITAGLALERAAPAG
jgi:3-oxoacyl-[acyl-carrier-protein] synthase-3